MASEVRTNKLSPASGVNLTLGDSGDTFTVPSGATLSVPSGATLSGAGAITIPSGGSLTIDSGATITNNGTGVGFSSPSAAFKTYRYGGYFFTGIVDNGWCKIPIGTYNSWGGTIEYDTASGFDQTNARWTCPSGYAGYYIIGLGKLTSHNNGSNDTSQEWAIYKNGSVVTGFDRMYPDDTDSGVTGGQSGIIYLAEGDYVEWWMKINFAANRFTGATQWGVKVG